MLDRRKMLPAARQLLRTAGRDPDQARIEMRALSLQEQVATVCEAPIGMRNRLLDIADAPEDIIPLLPKAELCFTCKQVGVDDASSLLAYATAEQIVACVDLDAWSGLEPDIGKLDHWMASLAQAGDEVLYQAASALDSEMICLFLKEHVDIEMKPSGDDDWQPPEGSQTIEGQFYIVARRKNDDLAPLLRLLHVLFQKDYWLYFRMMQSVREESATEVEEWALRWRTGRLEDLGFPAWDRAMAIYGHLREDRLARVAESPLSTESEHWNLPVWITELPAAASGQHAIFQAVSELKGDERARFFYAFLTLANKVAVADRSDLGDAETIPGAIEKAATVSSRGLEYIASENSLDMAEILRRMNVERLFRVGVNLSPQDVRPRPSTPRESEGEEAP